jgi:2-polyprenyl-6-hydroxyphenyl methylase/3-demethylubiquinone-9 3-methyltransferase
VLVDVGCGTGLLAPFLVGTGYRHAGVDLSFGALRAAREGGIDPVARGQIQALPVVDTSAHVVVAGEILEHVRDVAGAVGECARVLRPGRTLVLDTIAASGLARFLLGSVWEQLPGVMSKDRHDPALFVDRGALRETCARCGIPVQLSGLRPSHEVLAWLARRRAQQVRLVPTRVTAVLFQAVGVKTAQA